MQQRPPPLRSCPGRAQAPPTSLQPRLCPRPKRRRGPSDTVPKVSRRGRGCRCPPKARAEAAANSRSEPRPVAPQLPSPPQRSRSRSRSRSWSRLRRRHRHRCRCHRRLHRGRCRRSCQGKVPPPIVDNAVLRGPRRSACASRRATSEDPAPGAAARAARRPPGPGRHRPKGPARESEVPGRRPRTEKAKDCRLRCHRRCTSRGFWPLQAEAMWTRAPPSRQLPPCPHH
mmetsp:Transcript_90799/g.293133  ORF Transcript_90799/g.293133 Transcript_90799/m.293133 type:complete len:229 (-) Transcript_90799:126-812(-)